MEDNTKKWTLREAQEELNNPAGSGPFTLIANFSVRVALTPDNGSGIGISLTIPPDTSGQCYIEGNDRAMSIDYIAKALGIDIDAPYGNFQHCKAEATKGHLPVLRWMPFRLFVKTGESYLQ